MADKKKVDFKCEYIVPSNGQRCMRTRMHGSPRCLSHKDLVKYPSNLKPPSELQARTIKTLDNVVETTEWIFNQVYLGTIANEKGRILTDILKAQVTFLNEIYKRSPEGQEKTLDQIGRVVDMARRMTMEDASRVLLSKNFGEMLDKSLPAEAEILVLEEKNDGLQAASVHESDISGQSGQPSGGDALGGEIGDADI